MSRFLTSRIRRLEANQPPDLSTYRLPPENRAAVEHLIERVRANPGLWPDLEETFDRVFKHGWRGAPNA